MASESLRFDITGNSSSASRAFKETAEGATLASRAAKELDKQLRTEIKTAEVSAAASREAAKADKLLAEAEEVLSGRASDAARQLREQARAAEETAVANKAAGNAAKGASGGFGAMASPMGAAVVAGAALAPIAVTLGLGLGGLGLAALQTAKRTDEMAKIFGPLKGEVRDFQNSLQPQVLTLFGDGAGIAQQALHALQPVAAATGTALHGVLGQVGAELQSGQWKSFFQFMAAQAGPDLQLVGKLLVDLLRDFPPLLQQLQPAGRLVLILADDLLKAVGGLERMHLVLPILGAAIGFMVGGPLGALVGALGGVALQAASANTALSRTGQEIQNLSSLKPVTKDMVGFAAVAGEVALNLGRQPGALQAVQIAMATAHPVVGTLAGDMATLNATIGSGNSVLAAYADLWDKFVGKSVSYQQAVLNLKAAFEGYDGAVKSSGRTSTAAQQAFLSIFTTIGSGLDTLHKQGASISQVNDFYQTSIDRLNALHGLTPAQRADITGLTQDYAAWASTADKLNRNLVKAAQGLGQDMLLQVSKAHQLVPLARSDTDALANSILKTGVNSAATRSDRAALIRDLEQSGASAHAATSLVDGLQRKIDAMHGKTVNVDVAASGSGGINVAATGLAARIFKLSHLAAGARIPGFGGGDVHPALLEGGETVVDKHTSRQLAPVFRAAGVPGYASGGVAGMSPFAAGQAASAVGSWAGADVQSMLNSMIAAYRKTLGFLGAGSGNYAADIQAVLSSMGLPLSLTANWLRQIQTESGGNLNAVNLTDSNARAGHPSVGLLQLIPGTFHAYAGPYVNTPPLVNFGGGTVSENAMAQIYAAIHYAAARYGGAGMAGVIGQGHGYDSGGYLPTGWSMAWNGTGRPEPVIPAGRGGGMQVTVTIDAAAFRQAGLSDTQIRDIKATVRHLGGRGAGAADRAFASN